MQQTNSKTIRKGLEEGTQSQAFPCFIVDLYGYLEKGDLTEEDDIQGHKLAHLQFANKVRKKAVCPFVIGQSALGVCHLLANRLQI